MFILLYTVRDTEFHGKLSVRSLDGYSNFFNFNFTFLKDVKLDNCLAVVLVKVSRAQQLSYIDLH